MHLFRNDAGQKELRLVVFGREVKCAIYIGDEQVALMQVENEVGIVRDGEGKYSGDPDPHYENDQGHVSLCKPRDDYTRPIEFLIEAMKSK